MSNDDDGTAKPDLVATEKNRAAIQARAEKDQWIGGKVKAIEASPASRSRLRAVPATSA